MAVPLIISAAFILDRESRDLPCGKPAPDKPRNPRKVGLLVEPEIARDIIEDAAYQGWFVDQCPSGVVRAARTAFRDCLRQGVTYSKGVRVCDGGLLTPGDA